MSDRPSIRRHGSCHVPHWQNGTIDHERTWQLTVFVGALGATIILQRQFARYTLQTDWTPHGIIDFELAGSADWAQEIVDTCRAANLIENVRPNIAIVDARFIPC